MKRLLFAFALLVALVPAAATDLPFGGDTLHYLIRESDLVVRGPVTGSQEPAFGLAEDRYQLFRIDARSVLKGERALASGPVAFGVPASLPARAGDGGEAIAFLKRINPPTARALDAPEGMDYVAVSGGYGVIDLRSPERAEAVDALISAGEDTDRHQTWSNAYLTSSDPLLQRSALHLAYDDRSQDWAQQLILRAIEMPAVSLENRDVAIEMAVELNLPETPAILRRLAENGETPLFLRTAAVRAVRRLPEGDRRLAAWAGSRDQALRSLVAAVRAEPR